MRICHLTLGMSVLIFLQAAAGDFPNAVQLLKLRRLQETDSTQEILIARENLALFLQENLTSRPVGILIAAGGPILLKNAAALVGLIRGHFRCELPVEVLYNGSGEFYEPAVDTLLVRHNFIGPGRCPWHRSQPSYDVVDPLCRATETSAV